MDFDLDLYFYKVLGELEKLQSERSYKERTIFDKDGKKMRRKLENGYISGVKDAIKILYKVKKEVDISCASEKVEYKERAFI